MGPARPTAHAHRVELRTRPPLAIALLWADRRRRFCIVVRLVPGFLLCIHWLERGHPRAIHAHRWASNASVKVPTLHRRAGHFRRHASALHTAREWRQALKYRTDKKALLLCVLEDGHGEELCRSRTFTWIFLETPRYDFLEGAGVGMYAIMAIKLWCGVADCLEKGCLGGDK